MGNKMGIFQKVKIITFLLTSPTRKNILVVSCEHCGSTNVGAFQKEVSEKKTSCKHYKTYSAQYLCLNCKATCECSQIWSRMPEQKIDEIRDQIRKKAEKG